MSVREFYNSNNFDFVQAFEENWQHIHQEYLQVQDQLIDWPEQHLHTGNWNVFGLFDFPGGNLLPNADKFCPVTVDLIRKHIKNHGSAGFSKLQANSVINPHRGFYGDFLRLHLGLDIPEGDCRIKINDQTAAWHNGKVLIFDDRYTHEAWNKAHRDRVVLIVDFVPDEQIRASWPSREEWLRQAR